MGRYKYRRSNSSERKRSLMWDKISNSLWWGLLCLAVLIAGFGITNEIVLLGDPCIVTEPPAMTQDAGMSVAPNGTIGYHVKFKGLRKVSGKECWVEGMVSLADYKRMTKEGTNNVPD